MKVTRLFLCMLVCFLFALHAFAQKEQGSLVPLTMELRVQALSELQRAMKTRYIGMESKKARKIDINELFEQAILAEKEIQDASLTGKFADQIWAENNLNFFDRAKLLVAQFQDGHMESYPPMSRTLVTLGIKVQLVGTEVIVVDIDPRLMSFNAKTADSNSFKSLHIGAKLKSVDGKNPLELSHEYAKFESASSDRARLLNGASAIANRSFSYPQKSYSEIEFSITEKDNGKEKETSITLDMPWFHLTAARMEAAIHFQRYHILPLRIIKNNYNAEKNETQFEQRSLSAMVNDSSKLKADVYAEWLTDADGDLVFSWGLASAGNTSFVVLSLGTFLDDTVLYKNAESTNTKLGDVFEKYLKEIVKLKKPIVLDLRNNYGGSLAFAKVFLSYFIREQDMDPKIFLRYRLSANMLSQTIALTDGISSANKRHNSFESSGVEVREFLKKSLDEQGNRLGNYSKPYFPKKILTDTDVSFAGDLVVLTSAKCVSACEMAASYLQYSGRASVIGEPTHGTGFGFINGGKFVDTNGVLALLIPDLEFGFKTDREQSENDPLIPGITYEPTLKDYTENSQGWIKKAGKVLRQMKRERIRSRVSSGIESAPQPL